MDRQRLIEALKNAYERIQEPIPPDVAPEAYTKSIVIEPILEVLGYRGRSRIPEHRPGRLTPGWVDYLLVDVGNEPAIFLEAKPYSDLVLWPTHSRQVHSYIREYRLSPGSDDLKTVRWLLLTNGRDWHIISTIERNAQPFKTITLSGDAEADATAIAVLARGDLGRLVAEYNDSRARPLNQAFMQDLRKWREHLAKELYQLDSALPLEQIASISQRILDQIIFVRVLETVGLHPSFWLLQYFTNYRAGFRNRKAVPFGGMLGNIIADLEADLNTELLKPIPVIVERLPESAFAPIILPDSPMTGVALIQASVYNYDFRDLTFDLLGEIYEQYLSHSLENINGEIKLTVKKNLRSAEGAFYTPAPVVQFTTDLAMRRVINTTDFKTIAESLQKSRFIDIASGSGAFLLAAFRSVEKIRQQYNALIQAEGVLLSGDASEFVPSNNAIVAEHIFGIDKDVDAVEVARLNLWVELIRTSPSTLARSTVGNEKLPHLGTHVIQGDSIQEDGLLRYPVILDRLGIKSDDVIVFLGNPPWGAELKSYNELESQYKTFRGSGSDSAGIFIERIINSLPDGGVASLVLPDSIINKKRQHAITRQLLCEETTLECIAKLGEGFFEGVYRSAMVLTFRKGVAKPDHQVEVYIFTKADRDVWTSAHLLEAMASKSWRISQASLSSEASEGWAIFANDVDREFISRLVANSGKLGAMVKGRGLELNTAGKVVECADCGAYNPPARGRDENARRKELYEKRCSNCGISPMRSNSPIRTLVDVNKNDKGFVFGSEMHRLQIRKRHTLSLSGSSRVPLCPSCGYADAKLGASSTGRRSCIKCNTVYVEAEARKKSIGLDYKDESLYAGRKVFMREAGRGIYAALDTDSYCAKSIYIIRTDDVPYDPAYIAGVLSSRVLLYYYYKLSGNIEWQSFPRVPIDWARSLPYPELDLSKESDKLLHDEIVAEVEAISSAPGKAASHEDKGRLETLVRRAFNLSAKDGELIDTSLSFVEQFGPLLGEIDGEDEENDDEERPMVRAMLP